MTQPPSLCRLIVAWLCLGAAASASDKNSTDDEAPPRRPAAMAADNVLTGPSPKLPHLGPLEEETFLDEAERTVQYIEPAPAPWAVHSGASAASVDRGGPVYDWHLMPQGLIYRSYLAGAKESRFRSVWHHDANEGNIWDITLGGNVGLLRYGTRGDGRPEGWQLGLEGAGLVRLDVDEDRDVIASDFRGGVPLTWGDSIHQVKFAYYHLSSHVGDEFLLKTPGFSRINYSRDALVLGHSLYPTDSVRVYAEVEYSFYIDECDPWAVQFGVDYSPPGRTGGYGAPFAAVNGHLREEVNYGGNLVVQAGWAWRRSPATGLYRLGVEYYNGKDDQFSFFDDSVEKVGFGMWYDY